MENKLECCYFPTYISTSYNKNVSDQFSRNDGMLIQIGDQIINEKCHKFCSLEWISKFPDECEVLFARTWNGHNGFNATSLQVIDYEYQLGLDENHDDINTSILKKQRGKMQQIVKAVKFSAGKNITMLGQLDINAIAKIFKYGDNGRLRILELLDQHRLPHNFKKESVIEAADAIYNDELFKFYNGKLNNSDEMFELNQMDIIDLQKKSVVLHQWIRLDTFISHQNFLFQESDERLTQCMLFCLTILIFV